eukprot:jgi/Galph1/2021/GphlegSOOS_G686.1
MTTRDRTVLFKRYREESLIAKRQRATYNLRDFDANAQEKELAPFLNGSQQPESHSIFLPPEWLDLYEELTVNIETVRKNLSQLETLQQSHLLPGFEERSEEEQKISQLSRDSTLLLQRCEEKIRQLAAPKEDMTVSSDERILRNNAQKYFASKIQELSLSFRKNQKEYLRKLQGQNALLEETNEEDPLSFSLDLEEFDPGFNEQQLMLMESSERLAEERQREIMKIAASINDLATIVKDIASLVIDQGTLLDRIDYNVEEIEVSTQGAVKQLEKAKRNQKKGLAFCLILILSMGCGIMFLLLIAKLVR